MITIRHFLLMVLAVVYISQGAVSQVVISTNSDATADPAAILDLQSTSQGFLAPRMTSAQINAIPNPPVGLMIYQTDGAEGYYYNFGTPLIPQWSKVVDEEDAGLWAVDGDDIYNQNIGNIGIGTSTPGTKLDVAGPAWFNDSISIDGRPGRLYINAQTNFEPYLRLTYEDAPKYTMRYRIPDGTLGDDYFMIDSDEYDELWGISDFGRIRHTYYGSSGAGYYLSTNNPYASLDIENDNTSDGAQGINVSLTNASGGSNSIGIGSWNYGDGNAIYGENNTDGNFGYVGMRTWAIYGQHGATSNRGNFGTSSAGAMGIYDSEGFIGMLGAADAGVYGDIGDSDQNLADGDFGVKGYGVFNSSETGSGYAFDETIGGVVGYNAEGVQYGFGVAGYTVDERGRTGGVLGFLRNDDWGALGYRTDGGQRYGGYFNGGIVQDGNGKVQTNPSTDIGIGVYGDLFGAQVNGNVYGLYATGENYGIYSDGDMYRTGADVHIQENANGENSVMYTLVSTEMTVQTYGVGSMQAGKSNIVFDKAFADVVSNDEPIVVTITPIGQTKGVYLDRVDASGFAVAENNQGKSNVQFSWIAIGKRKGYENVSLPADVTASDYNTKVQRGLASDANNNTEAEGLYYHNGQLHNGQVPNSSRDNSVKRSTPRSGINEADIGIVDPQDERSEETTTKDAKIDK